MSDALTVTWQHLADAEIEHDADHAKRALAALARLQQRTSEETCRCAGHGCSACGGER